MRGEQPARPQLARRGLARSRVRARGGRLLSPGQAGAPAGCASACRRQTDPVPCPSAHTRRWLAPEILKGARASAQTDVFSYGVVLWEVG